MPAGGASPPGPGCRQPPRRLGGRSEARRSGERRLRRGRRLASGPEAGRLRSAVSRGGEEEEEEEGSAMTHLQAGLSPETLEKARLELNENPDTLHQDIQEVRDMVITRPDIGFLRTDDAFILRFLRARKFQHFEAFRLLAQYFEYRQQNLDMFKSFKATDPGIKQALKDGFPGGLANLDHYGRKILVLFAANWDQSR